MWKKHKITVTAVAAGIALIVAGLGSMALAQSGAEQSQAAQSTPASKDFVSRHVDYNVNLQVTGDLSAVDPGLQGVLPLNLNAQGGADIQPGTNGPSAAGDLKLSGFDGLVQKLTASGSDTSGRGALGAGIVKGILSDVRFTVIDKDLYLQLGGVWYDTGGMSGHQGTKPDNNSSNSGDPANRDAARACAEGAFPGGPSALLKDVKTVGQEDIDGVTTTHKSASVDIDKALAEGAAAMTSCGKTDEAAKLEAARAQITGAVKQVDLEWWTDADGQLRQAKATVNIEPAALAGLTALAPHPGGQQNARAEAVLKGIQSVTLDATIKFSRFGEQFDIQKPAGNITSLKDIMGAFGGRHGNGR
ncbi:MAG: hypothetical protein ACYCXF_06960 [Thermoleophilia bacterium]